MDAAHTPHGKVAAAFAAALVAGDFAGAHQMLSAGARAEWPPAALQSAYTSMIEHFEGPAGFVQVAEVMSEWPGKIPGDVGWAYVAIAGDIASEAVTVVVHDENGRHVIRSIEWGRP
jgi:hypothetical protein